jgi:hypothetical protein
VEGATCVTTVDKKSGHKGGWGPGALGTKCPAAASIKPDSACSKAWKKWREPVEEEGGGHDWWCTEKQSPGLVLEQKYDCDGDGEIDWTCHDKANANSGFIGSGDGADCITTVDENSGHKGSWSPGRLVTKCPAAAVGMNVDIIIMI